MEDDVINTAETEVVADETAKTVETTETVAEKPKKSIVDKIMDVIKGEKEDTPPATEIETKEDVVSEEQTTYTKDDVDRLVAEELAKQKEKERLAKMSPEDRKAHEDAEKDKKIEQLEKTNRKIILQHKAINELETDGFPTALSELLDYTSEETYASSKQTVTKVFEDCLKTALTERLKGKTPIGLNETTKNQTVVRSEEITKARKSAGLKD